LANPKVAFFKFSSCAGCLLNVLNIEPVLLTVLSVIDIEFFVMAKRDNHEGPYTIGFVEGAVTTPKEVLELKKIREECAIVVAMGTCAVTGGVPSIKNFSGMNQDQLTKTVYAENIYDPMLASIPAKGIDHYVKVDAYLRGCSYDKGELVELIKRALKGEDPMFRPHSVCNECKLKENVCLLISKGQPCMGSVSAAGCGALCPSLNRQCEGCRGPANDCNAASLAKTFMEDLGLSKDDVVRKFRKYAGNTPEFSKGAEAAL
jgi:coenzyme F420-reducing hydrogenase gamma subunit